MKSKYVFWLIAAIAALAIFISCARPRSPKEKQIHETDTIEQVVAPTVQEVLQWRESMRLDKYVDSVFLVMPEQVLTQILVTKGTDLSNHEIVSIYISNKDFYDKLIKRSMDIQKEYIPDSMPRSSLPQINSDTIHQAINYQSKKRRLLQSVKIEVAVFTVRISDKHVGLISNHFRGQYYYRLKVGGGDQYQCRR